GPAGSDGRLRSGGGDRLRADERGAARLEHRAPCPLHRTLRGRARGRLHHAGGTAVRDEHEPRAEPGLGAARRRLAPAVDLRHGASRRNAAGRSRVHAPGRRRRRPLRQAPPRHSTAVHLPLPPPGRWHTAPIRRERTSTMTTHHDVIIIGSGAGGGTLFHALASRGRRVLLLERGDYVPREKDNWSTKAVNLDGKYATQEVWRDRRGNDLRPHTNYYVGGNTKF